VVFECVGVPGVLDQIMAAAPRDTRIVVVGVCMEPDTIYPLLGIAKELSVQFVLGYTPDEFAATLGHIAEGAIPVAPLLTGRVGLGGVAECFVGQPFGKRVVDHERERPGGMRGRIGQRRRKRRR